MSQTINLGIDLGTTNSSISYFDKGEIKHFKDPVSWKDTLPSVVSFRKNRIIVGQKAKEYISKSPKNVVGLFKRKMGTNESFKIKSLNNSITPVELSSYVLKELKTFIQDESISLDSAVITIPASFDTIQSNATKEAGELAGFKEIVLLQEPIAASLAYANSKSQDLEDTKWIVYDLGGGTFDVALLEIKEGEMKVIDHEGDNFLGGSDFDRIIVENIIVPYLEENYEFVDLKSELQNATGKYNKLYNKLLHLSEEIKIQLSTKTSADIEFEIIDESDDEVDVYFSITRDEFENIIKSEIVKTVDMIQKILTKNSLRNDDIDFVLMIGGSTYIPFVKSYIGNLLGIEINSDIDPTTAVSVGAAYYAGGKKRAIGKQKSKLSNSDIKIKLAYEKATQDDMEYLAGRVDGNFDGYSYRIVREDGGYDSGLKELKRRISEDLLLLKDSYNFFKLTIYDGFNNSVQTESIEISQGKYTIAGQPLPEDISLEVDDSNTQKTKLELIFKKNSILPLKKSITKDINKTIRKDSKEEIIINLLEGEHNSIPEANKTLGFIRVSGKDITRDILKGSDIEITFEISESRDLTISAYISMIDQEFTEIFNPKNRVVNVPDLSDDIDILSHELKESVKFAKNSNNYEKLEELYTIQVNLNKLEKEIKSIDIDDTTDKRYQVEDRKRIVAQEYYKTIKDDKIEILKKQYLDIKSEVEVLIPQYGDYGEKVYFNDLVEKENIYLNLKNITKLEELHNEMDSLRYQLLWNEPNFIKDAFHWAREEGHHFKNQSRANSLIGEGLKHLNSNNLDDLSNITRELIGLMSRYEQEKMSNKIGFY